MKTLEGNKAYIELAGETYELEFTINVIDEIQETLNCDIGKLADLFPVNDTKTQRKNLITVLTMLVNENIEKQNETRVEKKELLTETYVKRHITLHQISDVSNAILKAYLGSWKESEEDEFPNKKSEPQN